MTVNTGGIKNSYLSANKSMRLGNVAR